MNSSDSSGIQPTYQELMKRHTKITFVQILVMIFLSINLLLIVTLFKNEFFYTTARYIFFGVLLLSDSTFFFITNIIYFFSNFYLKMPVSLCIMILSVFYLYIMVSLVTLTAMTLERYVAICMPLRHAELCSIRSTVRVIFIIHGLSSLPYVIFLIAFFATASLSVYPYLMLCSQEIIILFKWQDRLRMAVFQFYFLIMCIIIMFCYIKIMKVARTASGEDKISSRKGLRTVTLHAFQLLLCLLYFWYPIIESILFRIDLMAFEHVRFFNYILFTLAPRCLSPLIYGLRDDLFRKALKKNISCGLCDRNK